MYVNGEEIMLASAASTASTAKYLQSFLIDIGYDPMRVAVEHNGRVIPRATFEQILLSDSDVLEIVCFVGGG